MDLAALKNLDVKDLIEKIKSGGGAGLLKDKKTLIKFGSVGGAILIFLIIYYVFVSPVISAQEERLDIMNENQSKVDEYLSNINTLEARVKELEPRYKKSSKLFHSKKEVEDLYQNISNYAMTNGLSIINIKKGEPEPAGGAENSGENTEDQQALYYKIPVNYKIQGNYLGYLKFRRALSKSSKVINYDKETITVDAKSGTIVSEGTISIVGLPDEYNK
tara:strand:+ start:449 stop:1105 length:657 start_codon:yes stop_codon:yes gene_type:complete